MEKSKNIYQSPWTSVLGLDCEAYLCESPNSYNEGGAGTYPIDLIIDNGSF